MASDLLESRHGVARQRVNAPGLDDTPGGVAMAKATCSIPDCEGPTVGKHGWCGKHYMRNRRTGDPLATTRFTRDPELRFWVNLEVGHPAGCWWWTGKQNGNGYGVFALGPRALGRTYAHRFAYETLVAVIPSGLQLDHLCRNRLCCNPDHLQIVTPGENTRRGGPARKTHCKHGHRLAGDNLYLQPSTGRRSCQTCRRSYKRATALLGDGHPRTR